MTDAEKALKLWRELRNDPLVDKVESGRVVIYKRAEEQRSDDYDLRVVKI
jgi:hypothetical protein